MEHIDYRDVKFNSIDEFMEYDRTHDELLEYIDGEVYLFGSPSSSNCDIYLFASPSPYHEVITINIVLALGNYLNNIKSRCRVYSAPTDLKLGDNKFIPDLMVQCVKAKGKYFETVPPLIVEIISPGNISHDTILKRAVYEKFGVKEYWIVYPKEKHVDVCFLNGKKYFSGTYYEDEVIESKAIDGFKISLSELFKDAPDDEEIE